MIKKSVAIVCIILITSITSIISIFLTRYFNKKECEMAIQSLNVSKSIDVKTTNTENKKNAITTGKAENETNNYKVVSNKDNVDIQQSQQNVKDIIVSVEIIKQKTQKNGKTNTKKKVLTTKKTKQKPKTKKKTKAIIAPIVQNNKQIEKQPIVEAERKEFTKQTKEHKIENITTNYKKPKKQTKEEEQEKIVYNTIVIEEQ